MANTQRYRVRLYTTAYVEFDVENAVDVEEAAVVARTIAGEVPDEFAVYIEDLGDVLVEVETGGWEFMFAETIV